MFGVNGAVLMTFDNWAGVIWCFACFVVMVADEEYQRRMTWLIRAQSETIDNQQLLIKEMHSRLVNLETEDEIQPTV